MLVQNHFQLEGETLNGGKVAYRAYDRAPILGSSTDQILATAAEQKWTVIDMATDWANVHSAG